MLAELNPARSDREALGFLFSRRRFGLRLLPKRLLVETGPVDHADWNSRLLLGWISRQRFRMVQSQLPPKRIGRVLEIGYGSGVFLPELAEHSRELFGLDVHDYQDEVTRSLAQYGVQAQLYSATAEDMPFPAGHFDVVVGVSCLEFITDLAAAARETSRVLAPDGIFIIVSPNTSGFVDAGFRLLTGKSAEADFQGRRQRVVPTLLQYFDLDQRTVWPPGPIVPLYVCLRLRPKRASRPRQDRSGH
jgi:ubiquinone/menaquinone biosynthesis C-methylase UbiE